MSFRSLLMMAPFRWRLAVDSAEEALPALHRPNRLLSDLPTAAGPLDGGEGLCHSPPVAAEPGRSAR
jgi:hypothetical protein